MSSNVLIKVTLNEIRCRDTTSVVEANRQTVVVLECTGQPQTVSGGLEHEA